MTSAYLDRPTRQWAEANLDSVEMTINIAKTLRTALEGAEEIARHVKDRCRDGDSLARADDMTQILSDILSDYLKPLEDALQEDYEDARHQEDKSL